jgi:fluoride exporter
VSRRPSPLLVLAVAVAGACGALARYGLTGLLPAPDQSLPVATLLANLSGCLLLGLLVGGAPDAPWARPVLGTGLLGGWTTWSVLAVEVEGLVVRAPAVAGGYLLLSLLGGVALAVLGLRVGARAVR